MASALVFLTNKPLPAKGPQTYFDAGRHQKTFRVRQEVQRQTRAMAAQESYMLATTW